MSWMKSFFHTVSKFYFFIAGLILLSPVKLWASACCGGAFSIPAIITGDDKAQVSTSFSFSQVHADVTTAGLWRKRQVEDVSRVFKIEAAHIFRDRWQAGVSLPFQTRSKEGLQGGTSSGLGDVALQLGYEILPEWDYHPVRPKGVGFLTLTLPTGETLYESLQKDGGLSARGRGFWAVGAGTVLTKIHRAWDMSATLEIHRSFEKKEAEQRVTPGYGGSLSLGGGWNSQFLRLGSAITWTEEEAVKVSGAAGATGAGSPQRYATGTLSLSYIFPENWAGTLSYADQTLFGNPSNTTLSRSVLLLVQKRWNR